MKYDHTATDGMLIPDKTECEFEIKAAEDKTINSGEQAGTEVVSLTLAIWTPDGNERTVWDTVWPNSISRIKELCTIANLPFEGNQLDPLSLVGISGKCVIGIRKGKNGNEDRNSIRRYLINPEAAPAAKPTAQPTSQVTAQDMLKKAWVAFKAKTPALDDAERKAAWVAMIKDYGKGKAQSALTVAEWATINDRINNEYGNGAADTPPLKDDDIPF